MKVNQTKSPLKPFKLSRPKGLIGTTAHWWAVRYCFFSGKDNRTYQVTASLVGGGYYDIPPNGRCQIVKVHDEQGEVSLQCLKDVVQPLTYEESDALLTRIETELGIQSDSDEVKELEKSYNLS